MLLDELLASYTPLDHDEAAMTARLQSFLCQAQDSRQRRNLFGRELAGHGSHRGHITGSAWIVSGDNSRVVLVHHAKLGRWVQPGGHCDGERNVLSVALREAREETGLEVTPVEEGIFDIDVHLIPAYWNTPEHWHYDVRFLLRADGDALPCVSAESHAVRWVTLHEAALLNDSSSITRMIGKTLANVG